MRRPDRHDEIELNLLLQGSLTYLIGGRRVTIEERRLGAFWAAQPHQIIGAERSPRYYVITLPLAWVMQIGLPARFVDRLLGGHFLTEADRSRFELDAASCRQWSRELRGPNRPPHPAAALEIQARLLRFAQAVKEPMEVAQSDALKPRTGMATKAERMAAHIAHHHQEELTVEAIAREVGLHPNYAMALFRKTFHTTLNDYLTRCRVARAQRLLATTNMKVIEVGLESGFRTSSRFYDAFKRASGCSPNEYRNGRSS